MDDEPSAHDNALFARLNKLKKSNISFGTSNTLSVTTTTSEADETPDDLIARFEKINGQIGATTIDKSSADTVPNDGNGPPSPTIEELLAELGPEDQWTVDSTDLKEAHDLLAEAKHALPKQEILTQEPERQNSASVAGETLDHPIAPPKQEQDEEAEANASLQRILDELELEEAQELASSASPSNNRPPFPHHLQIHSHPSSSPPHQKHHYPSSTSLLHQPPLPLHGRLDLQSLSPQDSPMKK